VTDSRDDAEFLDGDALGEEPGDEQLPGTEGFPPDRPQGVDDPSRGTIDDVSTRELRRDVSAQEPPAAFALLAPDSSEGLMDAESQEIASAVDAVEGDLSPEEAALHIVDSSDTEV
jgi:hypothetical protein